MRATISFELELDKVESTMATLVSQESDTLRIVTNILDNVGEGPLLPKVSEAIALLQEATNQLQQYHQMLAGFEKAKFETLLPQPAEQTIPVIDNIEKLNEAKKNMQGLETFLNKIVDEAAEVVQEEQNDPQKG